MEHITLTETRDDYYDYYNYIQSVSYFVEEQKTNTFIAKHITVIIIILSIVIVLSLIGNTLVVLISVFYLKPRSLTSIFILNLALSDLLFTVGLVFWVYELIWRWTLGDAVCTAVHYIFSAGFYSNMVFLVLMSIQCYMVVMHPLLLCMKGRCVIHILICAWMVSILAALSVVVQTGARPGLGGFIYSNKTAFLAVTYKENIVFVCVIVIMTFCYIRIPQTIFKSPTNWRHRTTGLAFFLVATFFICWAPYNILHFLFTLPYYQVGLPTQDVEHLKIIIFICTLLAFTRCSLNPVIYGLFGLKFRKSAWEIFQRRATLNSEQIGIGERQSDSCV